MAVGDLTATIGTASEKLGASFDGVDDYVEIPHHASQLGANLLNGFTISAWVNPKTFGENTDARIIDKTTFGTGTAGFFLAVRQTGAYFQIRINAGTIGVTANNSCVLNIWTHILVTVSSAQLANLYINGVLSGTANQDLVQAISTITTTNPAHIGNYAADTTRTFDGIIKDVKMWNRVLTAAEITNDAAGLNTSVGQILWVPLKEDYNDKSVLGLTGTNSGSLLMNSLPNQIVADTKQINLAATTDKFKAIPIIGRDQRVKIIGVNRAAA